MLPIAGAQVVFFDRRRRSLGAPSGLVERRTVLQQHRATDALKMACPFCGVSESAVRRSKGAIAVDAIRRRRQCAGCGGRFPTSETVDREALERELAAKADPVAPAPAA